MNSDFQEQLRKGEEEPGELAGPIEDMRERLGREPTLEEYD